VKRSRAALVALLAVAGAWIAVPASPAVAAQGQLAFDGCLANGSVQGCFDLPFAPLDGLNAVAVSPDGKSVYVASKYSASVAHFFRDSPGGQLSYDGCLADDASQNCVDLPKAPLWGASGVAVSPDGRSVYVASSIAGSIARFFRDSAGARKTIKLALSKALRSELRRKRRLVLRLSVAVQDPAGNRRTVRRQVTPRLKGRRRA